MFDVKRTKKNFAIILACFTPVIVFIISWVLIIYFVGSISNMILVVGLMLTNLFTYLNLRTVFSKEKEIEN